MKWEESMITNNSQDLLDLCSQKTQKNSFKGHREDDYTIGLDISRFNHSPTPNVTAKSMDFIIDRDINCSIMYVYANDNINIGEELNIWYGNAYFGEKTTEIEDDIEIDEGYIQRIVVQYYYKEISRKVIFAQVCANYGIYLFNDAICQTPRFIKYFTETFNKDCTQYNIIKWLEMISTKITTARRIEYWKLDNQM